MEYRATFSDGSKASTLSHYGIKDQRWGVRRFQNPDGTLTPEGRRRYGIGEERADVKFTTSNMHALEGARIGGPLGAGIGKLIGMYKESKEKKQQAREEQVKKEETSSLYRNVLDRRKPLDENVKAADEQLSDICEAKVHLLADVEKEADLKRIGADSVSSGHSEDFARALAVRVNDRFDVDAVFDQRMDEYVMDYENGLISKSEFKKHYDAELDNYAAWVIDRHTKEELVKVAKTFYDDYDSLVPEVGYKSYLKSRGVEEAKAKPNKMTESAVDDFIKVLSGELTQQEYNEKYKGTGYRIN